MVNGNVFYSQYHEGRIGGDIIGNLTRGCVIDRLSMMHQQERTIYNYNNADKLPPSFPQANIDESIPPLNSSWREKICHWSFNVIDHFDLSREVVAVSMSLFDRFLATRSNRCNGSTALLASLTTLHIAIKVHEVRKIKLTTLANLSRGQFGAKHIEEMEWMVLTSLNWHIHPPTSMSFLSHLLLLLPPQVSDSSKEDIYALSRYITELSVCDSSFVEINPSAVAFSAILNSLEDRRYRRLISTSVRDQFLRAIATHVGLRQDDEHVVMARPKLKRLLTSSLGQDNLPQEHIQQQQSQQQQQQPTQTVTTVASVTSSVNGMQIQDSKADDSSLSSRHSRHSRTSSNDSITGQRRGRRMVANASPRTGRARVAPSPSQTVMSTSPCSLSSRSAKSVFSRHSRSPMTSLLPAS
mmetsp:Transcript_1171/g.2459  ORF Transcript_1171/g.2459 Transcript_1171/m.2459 type:complete len:411 (+) Transcript_1171:320-1552(+)|eukprot:CAMPEP_0172317568 /NCGR_PEP_ID=MMETSP1058-20130122/32017_1 /TAXON_ID=83371 /ORGANISM="Detonula confervacea, Strain CCMP 353" /LENGTH=410 /DNA_ID=CAMNT_0013032159 /DNA_START=207 /DNA_END=1439 /DNA_ORIENTATION=+